MRGWVGGFALCGVDLGGVEGFFSFGWRAWRRTASGGTSRPGSAGYELDFCWFG